VTRSRFASVLALVFVAVLVVSAPARLVQYLLPSQQVQLQAYSGTLWSGRAGGAVVAVAGGWLQLGELRWQLSPWSLLLLSPRVQLQAQWGDQRLDTDLQISPGGELHLRNSSISFAAGLVKQWVPIQLGGAFQLQVKEMHLQDSRAYSGEGNLVWQRAFWTGNSSSQRLGDYVLQFKLDETGAASGEVSTLTGPVQVEGGLELVGRQYSVDLQLFSEQALGSELTNALLLMAAPQDGGYHIKFSSEF
jgi:general secretion pathway protein N